MPCRFINISNDLKAITRLIQKELGYGSMNEEDVMIQLKAMEKAISIKASSLKKMVKCLALQDWHIFMHMKPKDNTQD